MERLLILDRHASRRLMLRRLAEAAGYQVDVMAKLDPASAPWSAYRAVVVDAENWAAGLRPEDQGPQLILSAGDAPDFPGVRLATSPTVDNLRAAIATGNAVAPDDGSLGSLEGPLPPSGFLSRDPRGRELLAELDRLADHPVSVLIEGESGTGKELLARALHDHGRRRGQPFVAVNCSAIPPDLLESEMFGHERGAFTDALRRHQGCFERAGEGTLFLDEIGDLPLELQPKLLRVLETGVLTRVGGEKEVPVRARVVSATHRDLRARIGEGSFREDLYHRLAVVRLDVPPLRRRPADLQWLTQILLRRLAEEYQQPPRSLSAATWERFRAHRWPGNVRELENFLRRSLLLQPSGPLELVPDPSPLDQNDEGAPQWSDQLRRNLHREGMAGANFDEASARVHRTVEEILAEARDSWPRSEEKGE